MFENIKYQYPAILWAILVLVLCDMPMSPGSGEPFFEGFDKLAHTGFFFVFVVFLLFGKSRQQTSRNLSFLQIAGIFLWGLVFGGFIELLQWKVFTYRSADWWDFFCDATGAGMATFSYLLFIKFSPNEKD